MNGGGLFPVFRRFSAAALAVSAVMNMSISDVIAAGVCWKPTHTRGVGELPSGCPGGWELGDVLGPGVLCYPKCNAGYNGKGPVCWQSCPDGFRNDGAFCRKPDGYWHGNTGRVRKSRCERDAGDGNCEYDAGLWYPKCKPGFTVIGLRCSPRCPSGMTDIGISCTKKSYGRGVGKLPDSCGPGKEPGGVIGNGILCYPSCKAGFTGRGPVCWGQCPAGYQSCPRSGGAMCATSKAACQAAIKEQIVASVATISKIVNVVKLADAGLLTADYVEDWISDALYEAGVETKEQLVDALKEAAKDTGVNYAQGEYESLSDAIIDAGKGIDVDWSKVDPTSLFDLISAYNHKTCELPAWAQEQVEAKVVRVKIQRVDYSQTAACPKKVKVVGDILFDRMPAVAKFRLRVNGKLSELHVQTAQEEIAQTTGGNFHIGDPFYIARFEKVYTLPPGNHTFRLEVRDSDLMHEVEREVTCPPFRVTKADLEFDSGEAPYCPREVTRKATFLTNGPGMVEYRREREGGEPSDWIKVPAKLIGDRYRAIVENTQSVGEIDQVRRVLAKMWDDGKRGAVASDWIPFKVDCLDIEDADIMYDGPNENTCRYTTNYRLRVNADMEHKLPYRLDCADGQKVDGILDIRETSPGTFIGVHANTLDVTRTQHQICALKAIMGTQEKTLTARGTQLECLDVLDGGLYIDGPDQGPCPTELDLRARFNARDTKPVGYGLKCSNGQSWTGKFRVQETGPGTFIGVMTKPLEIDESGQAVCALKSLATGTPKVIALRGKTFQCVDVARPGASQDLTGGQRDPVAATECVDPLPPADSKPVAYTQAQLARLGFDPGPVDGKMGPRTGDAIGAFQAAGELPVTGKVDTGLLAALQRFGRTWRDGEPLPECDEPQAEMVADPAPPSAADPTPEPETVADPEPETSEPEAKEPARPVLVCRNGLVRGGRCLCPPGWEHLRVSRFEHVCRRPAARIICDGGRVSGGRCECPRGWTLTKRSANRFACTRPRLRPIVCQNGVVRDGQCYCPRTMNRKRLSANRYRCVCNPGLRFVRGQCIRPAG